MKNLRLFFDAIAAVFEKVRRAAELAYLDAYPEHTRRLDDWLAEFGLANLSSQTEDEKRAKLAAAWKRKGRLDPRYLQDLLQSYGFDVYVHEWWVPGSEPAPGVSACAAARDPNTYLDPAGYGTGGVLSLGTSYAALGESNAQLGYAPSDLGYPLVTGARFTRPAYTTQLGESGLQLGESSALLGQSQGIENPLVYYTLPTDADKYPYFVYIGGSTFAERASIPLSRRGEFEALLLRHTPAHLWVGVFAVYT